MATVSNCSGLARLPLELVDNIFLEISSLAGLNNFFMVARFIYEHFKPRKERILLRVLQNQLGTVLADAQFLEVFKYSNPRSAASHLEHPRISGFEYRSLLPPNGYNMMPTIAELDQLFKAFYIFDSLTHIYIKAFLQQITNVPKAAKIPISNA